MDTTNADSKIIGYHFSKKNFDGTKAVKDHADKNEFAFGFPFERKGELYYGDPSMDESTFRAGDPVDGVTALFVATMGADDPGNPDIELVAPTFNVTGVEVFRAGTHTDSRGNTHTYKDKDIDSMVKAQRKNGVPIKMGSHYSMGEPGGGVATNLAKKGKSLLADFTKIPESAYRSIKEGKYPFRSAELNLEPMQFMGVALLGDAAPALDLKAIFSADDGGVGGNADDKSIHVFQSAETFQSLGVDVYENKNTELGGDDFMDEKLIEKYEAEAKVLSDKVAGFEYAEAEGVSRFEAAELKVTELNVELETTKKELADRDATIAGFQKQTSDAEKTAFFAQAEKKIMPSEIENYKTIYSYKVDGEAADFDAWKAEVLARNDHVALDENGGGNDNTPSADETDKTEEAIVAYAAEHDLDLSDHVQRSQAMLGANVEPADLDGDRDSE